MTRFSQLMAASLTLASLLGGCASTSMNAVSPASIASAPQTLSVQGMLNITGPEGYRVQTLTAWNLTNVDHVVLTLYKQVGGTYTATGATKTVANAALTSPVSVSNVLMATNYKIVAKAYADAAGTTAIDNIAQSGADTQCSVAFTTPTLVANATGDNVSDTAIAVTIPVKLMNKTFVGQASATTGVGVSNGTIINPTGAETF